MCVLGGEGKEGREKGIYNIIGRNSKGILVSQPPLSFFIDFSLLGEIVSHVQLPCNEKGSMLARAEAQDSEPNTLPDFLNRATRQLWVDLVSACLHLTTKLQQVFAQVQKFPLIL